MTHCLPIFLVRQMSEQPFNCYDQMAPLSDKSNIMLQRLVKQQQQKTEKVLRKLVGGNRWNLSVDFQKGISEWGWHWIPKCHLNSQMSFATLGILENDLYILSHYLDRSFVNVLECFMFFSSSPVDGCLHPCVRRYLKNIQIIQIQNTNTNTNTNNTERLATLTSVISQDIRYHRN